MNSKAKIIFLHFSSFFQIVKLEESFERSLESLKQIVMRTFGIFVWKMRLKIQRCPLKLFS